jgi:hypothetical protein
VRGSITTRDEHLELALDVRQQAAGAEAKQVRLEPVTAEFLPSAGAGSRLPDERCECRRRACIYLNSRALRVLADLSHHNERNRERRVDPLPCL